MEQSRGFYRLSPENNLNRVPVVDNRHTPMIPLYFRKHHIGYLCEHCGMFYTPSGKPSHHVIEKFPPRGRPGVVRKVENKAHQRRVAAGTEWLMEKLRSLWT